MKINGYMLPKIEPTYAIFDKYVLNLCKWREDVYLIYDSQKKEYITEIKLPHNFTCKFNIDEIGCWLTICNKENIPVNDILVTKDGLINGDYGELKVTGNSKATGELQLAILNLN